jgi:hypothetical protein
MGLILILFPKCRERQAGPLLFIETVTLILAAGGIYESRIVDQVSLKIFFIPHLSLTKFPRIRSC